MVTRVEVLSYEVKSVTSKKKDTAGQVFTIPEAQCVIHAEGMPPRAGAMNLPNDPPANKASFYVPSFRLEGGLDGKVFGAIDTLIPQKV